MVALVLFGAILCSGLYAVADLIVPENAHAKTTFTIETSEYKDDKEICAEIERFHHVTEEIKSYCAGL